MIILRTLLAFQSFVLPEKVQAVCFDQKGLVEAIGTTRQWIIDGKTAREAVKNASEPLFIRNGQTPFTFKVCFDNLRLKHTISNPDGKVITRIDEYPNFVCGGESQLVAGLCTNHLFIKDRKIPIERSLIVGSLSTRDILFAMDEDLHLNVFDAKLGLKRDSLPGDRIDVVSLKAFKGTKYHYVAIGSRCGYLKMYRWNQESGFELIGFGESSCPPTCLSVCRERIVVADGHLLLLNDLPFKLY